jgi:hypothetical protein
MGFITPSFIRLSQHVLILATARQFKFRECGVHRLDSVTGHEDGTGLLDSGTGSGAEQWNLIAVLEKFRSPETYRNEGGT